MEVVGFIAFIAAFASVVAPNVRFDRRDVRRRLGRERFVADDRDRRLLGDWRGMIDNHNLKNVTIHDVRNEDTSTLKDI